MKSQTIRVLLIENDEGYYLLTRQLFLEFGDGYELEWVSSYNEGLQAATRCEHDLILVDYRLEEENGVELIREAQRSGSRIPMILLTGQGDRDLDKQAMNAGAAAYLVKHETRATLLERILRFIIERRHIEEDLCRIEEAYRQLSHQQSFILNALPANIALVDSTGKIMTVNERWKKFATDNDFSGDNWGSGSNYLAACEAWPESSNEGTSLATSGIRDVLTGAVGQFEMEYPC